MSGGNKKDPAHAPEKTMPPAVVRYFLKYCPITTWICTIVKAAPIAKQEKNGLCEEKSHEEEVASFLDSTRHHVQEIEGQRAGALQETEEGTSRKCVLKQLDVLHSIKVFRQQALHFLTGRTNNKASRFFLAHSQEMNENTADGSVQDGYGK
ncbi:hypothetical protein TNCV_2410701 [Trichonephila clavipes]|nr:hypothetical protein TNCV_2410701 [Trichonephila clavipes]